MSDQRRPTVRLGRTKRDPRADSLPPSSHKPESKRDGADLHELRERLLARATQAEARGRHLEQQLARVNEERLMLELRMADLLRDLDVADTLRASLEAKVSTVQAPRRPDGPLTLAYVRSMSGELARALGRVVQRSSPSEIPTPRRPSDVPTPRPRTERPRR